MKILITGASGMVGRNLLDYIPKNDFQVLSPNRAELDLSNLVRTSEYLKKHNPDLIIHAAGRVGGIQANIKYPVDFLIENIDINRNLIGAASEIGIKKIINLGSSCMYPRNALNPLTESMILQGELEPTNEGYALAKIMAQKFCEYTMREKPDYQYKTLIPCNLYGKYDKFDPAHSHLIPAVIHKLHRAKIDNAAQVDIWGDGKARREFMYAGDLADCLLQVLANFDSLPNLLNVGLGHDYSINEYYQAAAEVIGYKGEFKHDLNKPVGMKQKLVSTAKLEQWGRWSAKNSLKEGLAKTYEYYLNLKQN